MGATARGDPAMNRSGVRERPGRPAHRAGGPVFDLVVSKLRRPVVRPGAVPRWSLIDRLGQFVVADPLPVDLAAVDALGRDVPAGLDRGVAEHELCAQQHCRSRGGAGGVGFGLDEAARRPSGTPPTRTRRCGRSGVVRSAGAGSGRARPTRSRIGRRCLAPPTIVGMCLECAHHGQPHQRGQRRLAHQCSVKPLPRCHGVAIKRARRGSAADGFAGGGCDTPGRFKRGRRPPATST